MTAAPPASARPRLPPHPIVYLVLFLPYGISSGYVTVTLGWLLSHAGASVAAVAGIAAAAIAPNAWKVLWAPLVDTTLSAKAWFMISILLTGAGLAATALLPLSVAMLPAFDAVVFVMSIASTISAMAVERFMAIDTPDALKGQAGGWSQAGNLGGSGLGGGAGLWIATHGQPWMSGLSLALLSAICAAPLIWMPEPQRMRAAGQRYTHLLAETARDVWTLVKTRIGLLACFIMILPIASGGAAQLWAALAADWGANADQVALVGGLLSGLVSIPGCIGGGYLADRMDRKLAYNLSGLALAAVAVGMACGPRSPMAFLVFASLYNLIVGFSYGSWAAVTLEAVGKGAVATKFNLISSISNVPILLITLLDGWAEGRYGARGMLLIEAAVGAVGVAFYMVLARATRDVTWAGLVGRRVAVQT